MFSVSLIVLAFFLPKFLRRYFSEENVIQGHTTTRNRETFELHRVPKTSKYEYISTVQLGGNTSVQDIHLTIAFLEAKHLGKQNVNNMQRNLIHKYSTQVESFWSYSTFTFFSALSIWAIFGVELFTQQFMISF